MLTHIVLKMYVLMLPLIPPLIQIVKQLKKLRYMIVILLPLLKIMNNVLNVKKVILYKKLMFSQTDLHVNLTITHSQEVANF